MVAAHLIEVVLCALSLAQSPADSQTWEARLDGAQVVPPNESVGTGYVILDYSIDYWVDPMPCSYQVTFRDLTGTATGAYMRWGRAGTNGPLAQEILANPFDSGTVGVIEIPQEVLDGLWGDSLYVVITTSTYPEGEVRGVFENITPPAVLEASWGRIRALLR